MLNTNFLKKIPFFLKFSDNECKKILKIARQKTIDKGKVIFEEGQRGDGLYIITKGEVVIEKQPLLKSTSAVSTLHLKSGDFFGELALFEKGTRTATARTLEDTDVVVLTREGFLTLLRTKGAVASKLFENCMHVITFRIRQVNQELMAFYEVGRLLSAVSTQDELLENLLQILVIATEAKDGMILFKNVVTGEFELKGIVGNPAGLQGKEIAGSALVGKALVSAVPLVISDFIRGKEWRDMPRLGFEKKSMLLFPFGAEVEKSGVIILADKRLQKEVFTQNDSYLVTAVMREAEAALENIQFRSADEGRMRLQRRYFTF